MVLGPEPLSYLNALLYMAILNLSLKDTPINTPV